MPSHLEVLKARPAAKAPAVVAAPDQPAVEPVAFDEAPVLDDMTVAITPCGPAITLAIYSHRFDKVDALSADAINRALVR